MDRSSLTSAATGRNSRPRVVFVIGSLLPGGSERQLVELLVRIHPQEVDATLITWDRGHDSPARKRLLDAGVRHEPLAPLPARRAFRRPVVLARLARILRSVRPDVVYPWLEEASLVVAPIARAHGMPVAIARRNISGASIEKQPLAAWAIRRAERLGAVVTVNSVAVLDAAKHRGIPPDRLRLVRNGHPELPPLPLPAGSPVAVGYVARFRPEKGHRRLLSVLRELDKDGTWRVDLAGEGLLMPTIAQEVESLGLSEHVRLVGPVDDIRGFWRDRAIGVLLSDHEGSPNALIEAAFCGRPLLGTEVGGIPEVIAPSGGILVSPDNPQVIAEQLAKLIRTETLRRQLGQGAYQQAQQRFAMTSFVQGHLDAIREASSKRQSPRRRLRPGRRNH
jgi:glycosyltransferase involved in cell wall biosynthesis